MESNNNLISGLKLPDGSISKGKRVERTFRLRNAFMAKALNLKGKKVLDIGCSVGLHSMYIAESADFVVGVDHDKNDITTAVNTSKALSINNVQFITGDIRDEALFSSLGHFDLIIAWGLLHRIADPFSFFILVSKLGDALSLEWRTPVLPFLTRLSMAYHSTASAIDPTNINMSGMENSFNKIERDTGFWDMTPGAVSTIARRVGFTKAEILGYGELLKKSNYIFAKMWFKHFLKRFFRKNLQQAPSVRVHMLLQKREGLIDYTSPLDKSVKLPSWDYALRERHSNINKL